MKNFLVSILIINMLIAPALALELDTSLDDEIRRNYNPNKIDEDMGLPALPKVLDEKTEDVPVSSQNSSPSVLPTSTKVVYKKALSTQSSFITLRKGTKIKAKILNNVSDYSKKGTKLTFITTYPVSTTYFTIPSGTTIIGTVVNSHRPWLSADGGLVQIKLNSILLNSEVQPVNAYVTKANSKIIFFNNIKGKRKYVKSMLHSMKPGAHFCRKMLGVTSNLAKDGSSIILSPFSLMFGVAALGGNVIASPVIALFYKGGHISIKSGTDFEFKLAQDVFIYN